MESNKQTNKGPLIHRPNLKLYNRFQELKKF